MNCFKLKDFPNCQKYRNGFAKKAIPEHINRLRALRDFSRTGFRIKPLSGVKSICYLCKVI